MARERRRIEYSPLGAEKISHRHFEVMRINDNLDEGSYKLRLSNIELEEYPFPLNAELSVSVRKGNENVRTQPIGTVGWHPKELLEFIVDFENKSGSLACRLNVTEVDEIHYLGFSDWRHPTHLYNQGPFEIREEDLGDLIWNFEIPSDDTAKPALIFNSQIPNLIEVALMENILLQATILPTAFKMGYEVILANNFEGIQVEGTWQNLWWEIASKYMDDAQEISESEDTEKTLAWCLDLIKAICAERGYKEAFIQSLRSEEGTYEED